MTATLVRRSVTAVFLALPAPAKPGHDVENPLYILAVQCRVHRQRDHLRRQLLGHRIRASKPQPAVRRRVWHQMRIVDTMAEPVLSEVLQETLPEYRDADGVLVVDMVIARRFHRRQHPLER